MAAVIDSLPGARLLCVWDHDGNVLLGKPPAEEPNLRAQMLARFDANDARKAK